MENLNMGNERGTISAKNLMNNNKATTYKSELWYIKLISIVLKSTFCTSLKCIYIDLKKIPNSSVYLMNYLTHY